MGYEGGVGAFVKMAGTYRIDLKDMVESVMPTLPKDVIEEAVDAHAYAKEQGRLYELPDRIWICCEALKRLWRRSHPQIAAGWTHLKNMAIAAVQNPGVVYKIPNGKVLFKVEGDWLIARLPSGRKLHYYRPEVRETERGLVLYYYGIHTVTRQWGRTSIYGGAWDNNIDQGSCRCLLTRAKLRMRERGLPLIGSVHDEPLLEVPVDSVSDQEITEMMCGGQTWDEGLPLAVEIHRGGRYRK
jgi:DNA polymerase